MKFISVLILSLVFTSFSTTAQTSSDFTQTTDDLRAQLLEVQAKEAELQTRVRQLDEDLKPDNIERSLAGVGSTRPEELRELRRRQLNTEKQGVLAQLKIVATSRERLQSVISAAETADYQKSAEGSIPPSTQMLTAYYPPSPLLLVGVLAIVIGIFAAVFAMRRLVSHNKVDP